MTQDEIIEITRQAGGFDATPEFLERFVKLVTAKEREACAKVCEKQIKIFLSRQYATGQPLSSFGERHAVASCVEAIRARGEQA